MSRSPTWWGVELQNIHNSIQAHPISDSIVKMNWIYCIYKARHAHKRLYTVLPKYSKIQVLPSITSCRLMKYNKQAIELNSLLNK